MYVVLSKEHTKCSLLDHSMFTGLHPGCLPTERRDPALCKVEARQQAVCVFTVVSNLRVFKDP